MKIFLLNFSGNKDFVNRFPSGHQIEEETSDGAKAYKTVGEELPDKIFINYSNKPSHGRQAATAIKSRKRTANIPIYFVDGKEAENEKVKHIGTCINAKDIAENL
jgi:DNA-binding response OmpR family regulator